MKIKTTPKCLDYRQLRCPVSLVQAKLALQTGLKGERFQFHVLDKTFYTDLKKLEQKHSLSLSLKKEQNEGWLVEVELKHDYPFTQTAILRKIYD